jgi:uncharacterized protein (DUF1697 family)
MPVYIAILRGINVSGQRLIKMEPLRELFVKMGFEKIATYIQSGSIVFQSIHSDPKKLEKIISAGLKGAFGFNIPVLLLTVEELKAVALNNPFISDDSKDASFLHVTFFSAEPEIDLFENLKNGESPGEVIELEGKAIYLYCPNGYGRTRLTNTFLEKKLKVTATTRNWKTVNALLEMAARG